VCLVLVTTPTGKPPHLAVLGKCRKGRGDPGVPREGKGFTAGFGKYKAMQ
jgi:hypothetical protein